MADDLKKTFAEMFGETGAQEAAKTLDEGWSISEVAEEKKEGLLAGVDQVIQFAERAVEPILVSVIQNISHLHDVVMGKIAVPEGFRQQVNSAKGSLNVAMSLYNEWVRDLQEIEKDLKGDKA